MTWLVFYFVLSALSLAPIWWMLAQPYRLEHFIVAPLVVAPAPDMTLDWRGLVD